MTTETKVSNRYNIKVNKINYVLKIARRGGYRQGLVLGLFDPDTDKLVRYASLTPTSNSLKENEVLVYETYGLSGLISSLISTGVFKTVNYEQCGNILNAVRLEYTKIKM